MSAFSGSMHKLSAQTVSRSGENLFTGCVVGLSHKYEKAMSDGKQYIIHRFHHQVAGLSDVTIDGISW